MSFIEAVRQLWERLKKIMRKIARGFVKMVQALRPKKLSRKEKKRAAAGYTGPQHPNCRHQVEVYRPSKIAEEIADQELTEPVLPVTEIERELWAEEVQAPKAVSWQEDLAEMKRTMEIEGLENQLRDTEAILRMTKQTVRRKKLEKRAADLRKSLKEFQPF